MCAISCFFCFCFFHVCMCVCVSVCVCMFNPAIRGSERSVEGEKQIKRKAKLKMRLVRTGG